MKRAVIDPVELLNQLMVPPAGEPGMPRWRKYFGPVPALSAGLPVPILGIMVLVWQLREKDLRQRFHLNDSQNRLDFIAWCAWHGGREYQALRDADAFWSALGQPASFDGEPLAADDPGHCISWLMALLPRERQKLDMDLSTVEGRRQLLAWYVLHGQLELPFVKRPFQPWQTDWLFAASGRHGLSRLQALVYDALPTVQKAFPLPAGRAQFMTWMRKHFCVDTKLVSSLCLEADLVDAGATLQAQPATPATLEPGVNVIGYAFGQLGIGEDARMAARSLLTTSVPVTMVDFPPGKEIAQSDRSMAAHVSERPRYATNLFCMTALEQGRHFAERGVAPIEGRRNIGYWPWELPKYPRQWQHLLALVDEVWVSSGYIRDGLEGISPVPVRVMPMAVEVTTPSALTRRDFGLPEKAKLFIFAFDLNSSAKRKNPVACLEAFRRAFPLKGKNALGREQVGLVIKVHAPSSPDADWEMLKRIKAQDPRIHLIEQTLSTADLMALYKACDCFVSLHRAEGFGRGIAEAMLIGKPVIATGFSGNLQFTRPDNALLVKHQLVPLLPGEYLHGEGQYWADPDVDDAAARMLSVFKDPTSVQRLAQRGHDTIASEHDIIGVGRHYREFLGEQVQLAQPVANTGKPASVRRRRPAHAA